MRAFLVTLFALALATAADASALKSHYGHYYATNGQDNTTTSITHLCGKQGVTGINFRMNWTDVEPTDGNYTHPNDFDNVLTAISGMGAATGSGGTYVPNSSCRLWLFVQWKVFSPGNPCPLWLKDANGNPGFAPNGITATGPVLLAIGATAVTNASPIKITTATNHGFSNGDTIFIDNVAGNKAANGVWTIANVTLTTFTLTGSHGSAARVQSGTPTGWYGRATKNGVFTCKVWDSNVLAKWNAMTAALGAYYDSNPNVEGFTIQESSVSVNGSFSDGPAQGGDYSGASWTDNNISMMQHCGTAFPTSRCMDFINFIQGNQAGVHTISAAITAMADNQGCYSGPDILPDNAGLIGTPATTGNNGTYQALVKHVGCRSDSAQNTTIVGDANGAAACAATNCNNVFAFAVQGIFGKLTQQAPAKVGEGLCINSYIFWNDTAAEQAKVDPTIKANPYGVQWYGQCSCGGSAP